VAELYPVPDPVASDEAWLRFHHQDLGALSREELSLERHRLELRLVIDPEPDPWLRKRLEAIEQAVKDGV
jgi:hypothetical protein